MKRIFMIDWALTLLFALTAYTGIKLHIAGQGMATSMKYGMIGLCSM